MTPRNKISLSERRKINNNVLILHEISFLSTDTVYNIKCTFQIKVKHCFQKYKNKT